MIRYSLLTIPLLLATFALQPILPVLHGFHEARFLPVQVAFLCCALTVGQPTMLLLAFIGGFLWDAHSVLIPLPADPGFPQPATETLRFGSSTLLFAAAGLLMQGIQPLFRRGHWRMASLFTAMALLLWMVTEFSILSFLRGEWSPDGNTSLRILVSVALSSVLAPAILRLLHHTARACGHSIHPDSGRRRFFER